MASIQRIAATLALSLMVVACGSDSKPTTPESVSEKLGCLAFVEEDTEEMFVRSLYKCDDDTSVYFFNSKSARDSWLELAEDFGAVVLDKGSTWLHVKS